MFSILTDSAADAGRSAGESVIAGRMTPEQAGDYWLKFADASHAAGVAFQRAYDATGADR